MSKKFIKNFGVKKICQKNLTETKRNNKKQSNNKFSKENGPHFSCHQSLFLEAPLNQQADGELKDVEISRVEQMLLQNCFHANVMLCSFKQGIKKMHQKVSITKH